MNKAKIIEGTPQVVAVPKWYTFADKTYVGDFDKQSDEIHEQAGYYNFVYPTFTEIQKKTNTLIWVETENHYTYEVIDKTQAELQAEIDARIEALDNQFDQQAAKRLLRKVAEPILADEANLTEQDIEDAKMLYKQYRVGVTYDKDSTNIDEKRFVWNGDLYKVIGARHTSQADWTPNTAVSLYVKITPPGVITVYSPRTAENAYMTGDKVYYPTINDSVYMSVIDNNVWSPDAYPAGWQVQ